MIIMSLCVSRVQSYYLGFVQKNHICHQHKACSFVSKYGLFIEAMSVSIKQRIGSKPKFDKKKSKSMLRPHSTGNCMFNYSRRWQN